MFLFLFCSVSQCKLLFTCCLNWDHFALSENPLEEFLLCLAPFCFPKRGHTIRPNWELKTKKISFFLLGHYSNSELFFCFVFCCCFLIYTFLVSGRNLSEARSCQRSEQFHMSSIKTIWSAKQGCFPEFIPQQSEETKWLQWCCDKTFILEMQDSASCVFSHTAHPDNSCQNIDKPFVSLNLTY